MRVPRGHLILCGAEGCCGGVGKPLRWNLGGSGLGSISPVLPPINSAMSGLLPQADGQGWSSHFTETERPAEATQLSKSGLPTSGPARPPHAETAEAHRAFRPGLRGWRGGRAEGGGEGGGRAPSAQVSPFPGILTKRQGSKEKRVENSSSPKPSLPLTSALGFTLVAAFPPFIVCFLNNIKKIAIYPETLGN